MTGPVDAAIAGEWADALIHGRRTVLPKRLAPPGPDAAQLQRILGAAAAAPDHGELVPWRFILIPEQARSALADVFAAALRARDAQATDEQLTQARDKAFRAPLLLLAVVRLGPPGDDIPPAERLVSAGCAIQNVLLMATALGFGSALPSGKALGSGPLRALFRLDADEQALCFVSMGTIAGARRARARPGVERYVSELKVER
ncbi:MAG TPA: nitroreductase [Ramlibacter sp.]